MRRGNGGEGSSYKEKEERNGKGRRRTLTVAAVKRSPYAHQAFQIAVSSLLFRFLRVSNPGHF